MNANSTAIKVNDLTQNDLFKSLITNGDSTRQEQNQENKT